MRRQEIQNSKESFLQKAVKLEKKQTCSCLQDVAQHIHISITSYFMGAVYENSFYSK